MAKKVRRVRRLSATQTYEPIAESATTKTAQPTASAPSRTVNFSEEYRYLLADLRRIGILAAIILTGLVGLSFFIN